MPVSKFRLTFDAIPLQKERIPSRYDALTYWNNKQLFPGKIDVRSLKSEIGINRFHSFNNSGLPQILTNRFDILSFQNSKGANRWDAVNDFPNGVGRLASSYDILRAFFGKFTNRFHIDSDYAARMQAGRFPVRLRVEKSASTLLPIRLRVLPQEFLAFLYNRFDSTRRGLDCYPARKQAFVKPGWHILAKDILTNEIHDLGFIDAESPSLALENVFLPDGEYEVSVLTSSLFWKDASDLNVRLLTIKPGEEVSLLPTIYNLRSSVSQGERTIYWSANGGDVEDCVFGVWYFSTSPVPTDGPPSETVWYFSELTEYQTSFKQLAPCYVAVAAMRPGNEPEIGKVHELYLDWKSTPPRPPDDVVVLDRFQASDGRISDGLRPPGNTYFENF
jgi:hypothetical protein